MIYCTTQPIEKYDVTVKGETVGLHMTYNYSPPLLNLILLTTLVPFDYEEGTKTPPLDRIVQLDDEYKFISSLDVELNGEKLTNLVSTLNPLQFYTRIKDEDLTPLPLCDYYHAGQDGLKMVTAARAVAWAMSYRGALEEEGNVTKASFGGGTTVVPEDMLIHYRGLVDAIKKARN